MIFRKLWHWLMAKLNGMVNGLRLRDPIAEMQYECDRATEQMKDGRQGLERQRGLIERVARQVSDGDKHLVSLKAKVSSYLASGDRETAGRFALELQSQGKQLEENRQQLKLHEESYANNLLKIKHASGKIAEVRNKIAQYDAELKMSKTEAEIAQLAQSLQFNVTTDFGQVEQIIQDKIDGSRAVVRVAADLSGQGLDEIRQEQAAEGARAEQALLEFEGKKPMEAAP